MAVKQVLNPMEEIQGGARNDPVFDLLTKKLFQL
jgi:hypothetical protein